MRNLNLWQNRAAKLQTIVLSLLILTFFVALALAFKSLIKLFIFGLLINYLLSQPTKFLTKYLRFKPIAIFICFVSIIGFFIFIIELLSPIFKEQSSVLGESLPQLTVQIRYLLSNSEAPSDLKSLFQTILSTLEGGSFQDFVSTVSSNLGYDSFYNLFSVSLIKSVNIITELILTLIISFYLLLDGERLWQLFTSVFPQHYLEHLTEIKKRIDSNLYSLVIGQFKIATMTATVMFCTYLFIASQFAILLGSLQMLEFIPILGTWTAIVPSILIVFATGGQTKAIIAASVYLIYTQIIRDHIIAPRVIGSAFGIHPLVVIFGLLIGIQIFGLIGIVVSLPIIAITSAIVDYLIKFKDTSNL